MTDNPTQNENPIRLRAEQMVGQNPSEVSGLTPEETRRLVHELQVHQVELELQNEELRRTMDQLELTRQRFFTLFEQAPVGYLVLNEVGMIRQVNHTFCAMINRPHDDIINHPVAAFIEMPEREVFLARFRAFFRNPTGKSMEARFLRGDGQDLYARLQGMRIQHLQDSKADGNAAQLLLTASDITELKLAGKSLQESEERYHRLTENALDIIYRYELLPSPHFSYVSPAATELTGYTPADHYNDPQLGYKLVHPDDVHLLNEALQPGRDPRTPLLLRWVRKDGRIIWTEQRNAPVFDETGRLVALEGIARDVTQRKRDEEALRASLQENQMLFRELQHRTKNSMAMIASLVSLETASSTDPAVVKALSNVRDRIRTLSELYRMLFVSGDTQAVRLDVYFTEIVESLKYSYGKSGGIQTTLDLDAVTTDEKNAAALGLILNELVTNAFKYAFSDGRTGQITVRLKRKEDQLHFQVEDNGVGLKEGFRIEQAEGMGMQLVSMLSSQLKGKLTYTNGTPTRFEIIMPMPKAA